MANTAAAIVPAQLLSGCRVLESAAADSPTLVHFAIAFAGRLLCDLGATTVYHDVEPDRLARLRSAPEEPLTHSGGVAATYLRAGKQHVAVCERDDIEAAGLLLTSDPELATGALHLGVPTVLATALAADEEMVVSELGIQGLVGLTDLFGEPDAAPLMLGGHQCAYAFGFAIFAAALGARAKRALQGTTDVVQVNAVDALAWVNWKGVAAGALNFPIARAGQASEAPALRCNDGYFALLHLPAHWDDLRAEVNDERLDDPRFAKYAGRVAHAAALNEVLGDWAATRSRAEIYDFCQRCAIPGGPVLSGADLLQDPLYAHRGFLKRLPHPDVDSGSEISVPGLPLTIEASTPAKPSGARPSSRWTPEAVSGRPLAGLVVLDLGIFTAGSVTSTLLGDLGARVIKVESSNYSDPFRVWPGIKGDSPLFTFNNRNKLGIDIDLKTSAGHEQFLSLVCEADVVVENFRRGVLDRLGIGYDVLSQANPGIVLASVSGQGASGPGSQHVSFGSTLEALAGITALTGYPGGPCYISGRNLNYPDQIVCLYGAGATLAAIMKARESGIGLHIDVSQREVATLAVGETVASASLGLAQTDFAGNQSINAWFQDILPAADGWLCVTVHDAAAAAELGGLLGVAEAAVIPSLPAWVAAQPARTAAARLQAIGIAAFKANSGAETAAEPLIASGGAFARTPTGVMVKGFPFQFRDTPLTVYEESPRMGEHTEAVLAQLRAKVSHSE